MLRSRSKGVAKKSQPHARQGDGLLYTGSELKALREIGMNSSRRRRYYPDFRFALRSYGRGGVRAWPRMTRNELARLFPADGKTMHIPSDGKPLPGYEQAVADYKRRVGASAIQVAGGGAKGPGDTGKRRNLFAALFGGGGDEDEEPAAIAAGGAEEEAPARVQTASAPAAQDALPGVAGSTAAPAGQQDINAPVPAVRPAFKETPADGGVAVALVAPEKNSAQEALAAAMPQTAAVPSEFADLSTLKVPVPQMLDRRDMNALIANETLVASADGQAQEFGFVPVPGMRPAGEEALAAVAHAEVTIPASADGPALASAAQPPSAAGTRVALAAPTSENRAPAFSPAIEVAAYAPQSGSASREAIFDSVFDTEADAPSKGARPKRQDAQAKSRSSVRTEPKLTQKIISEWALSAGRVATLSKPVKAPRFVSKSLRVAPTTVYAAGFTSNSGAVDTARFSGSAVNFMEVKKFSTN